MMRWELPLSNENWDSRSQILRKGCLLQKISLCRKEHEFKKTNCTNLNVLEKNTCKL